MKPAREALLLSAACALAYFTGIADIPFYTRGEPREGLVVRHMLQSGDWLVPARAVDEPARKPPLYYWTAAAVMTVVPARPEMALRLPSGILATLAVLGVWATGRAAFGPAAGLPAALILATSFEWMRAATSARVDMTLAAALSATLAGWTLVLVRAGTPRHAGWLALAAAGSALGVLAKGPVGLVLPSLSAVALLVLRGERRLRAVRVLGAAAVLAGVWYGAAIARGGTEFLALVARENWLRFLDAEDAGTGHAHFVGYLVPLGLVGWLPWTPLLPLALAPLATRPRPPAIALASAWVVCGFVFFSLAAAKRSVYLLPLFPALALLIGAGVAAPPAEGRVARAARFGAALYAPALLVLAGLATALALGVDAAAVARPWLKPRDAAGAVALASAARAAAPALGMLALLTAIAVPLVARAAHAGRWIRLVQLVAVLTVLWTAAFDALLHPAIARERSLRAFLARVDTLVPRGAPLYVRSSAKFSPDPGLRFYTPRPLEAWPRRGVPTGGHLLLWEDEWRRLRDQRGRSLAVLALSDVTPSRRGRLALVDAPHGPITMVEEPAGP